MEFSFPKIDKITVYPRTFLKDVCVSLCFKPVLSDEDALRNFIELRKECFSIPKDESAELKSRGEEGSSVITSGNNQIRFSFYRDAISLKMWMPSYKKFADLLVFMPEIVAFLKCQGVNEVESLRITKFNEIQYGLPSDNSSVEIAMKGIFSTKMMKWEKFVNPDFAEVVRWERRIDFSDVRNHAEAMVTYGFIKNDTDRNKGALTLKTSVEKTGAIPMGRLNEELQLCNISVDSAFHWAASDDILKEMRKK